MSESSPDTPTGAETADRRGTPPGKGQIVPVHGGRIGNPAFVPTDQQRAQVRTLAQVFPPAAQRYIAIKMGFSEDTLIRHFRDDLDLGRADMLAAVGAQYINRALNKDHPSATGDPDAQRFVLARLAGWSNKLELTGRGGGPIETVDLSRLNAEQLAQYGRLAAIAAGVDPDTIIAVPTD